MLQNRSILSNPCIRPLVSLVLVLRMAVLARCTMRWKACMLILQCRLNRYVQRFLQHPRTNMQNSKCTMSSNVLKILPSAMMLAITTRVMMVVKEMLMRKAREITRSANHQVFCLEII